MARSPAPCDAWSSLRWSFARGLFCFAFTILLVGCEKRATDAVAAFPRAHFSIRQKDLGEVGIRESGHEAQFLLTNRGNADLTIDRLITSCTCAGASANKFVVRPGENASVQVRIAPRRAEEKSASVTVLTNDPVRPKTVLVVRWRAVAELEFDPLTLDFGTVAPGERTERTVRLVRRTEPAIALERIAATPPDRLMADVAGSAVRVTLTPESNRSDGTGRVTLFLPPGEEPSSLSLPVRWKVRHTIEAVPENLYLGFGSRGHKRHGELVVTSYDDGAELVIRGLSLHGLPGKASWRRIASNRVLVSLTVTLPDSAGPASGELSIECCSSESQPLRVPISAFVTGDEIAVGEPP